MFPQLSDIHEKIVDGIKNTDSIKVSKLNCFVRVISGAGNGLVMSSNPDWKLFTAAGIKEASFYGDSNRSGAIGVDWFGNPIYSNADSESIDTPFKPSPIVNSINIKEGKDQISRHCDLKLTAFTLAQVETLQTYLMEPGYSLLIEYGWNTELGVGGLIPLNVSTIVSDTGKYNLDQDFLYKKRIKCEGEYDSFFGFIVGGNVSSNGDLFDIDIKLRGAPGLPTYLQSHNSIEETDKNTGKATNSLASTPFGVNELNLEAQDQMAERRFKKMFNDLPTTRQTTPVKSLLFASGSNGWSNLDFINIDPVIDNQISNFRDGRTVDGAEIKEGDKLQQPKAGAASAQQASKLSQTELDAINRKENIAMTIAKTQMTKAIWPFNSDWEDYVETWKITQEEIDTALKDRITVTEIITQQIDRAGIARDVFRLQYDLKPLPPPPAEPTPVVTETTETTETTVATQIGTAGGGTVAGITLFPTEIRINGGLPISKEKLFSKNKYIRFGKAVSILNANSAIESIRLADRNINIIFDISDTAIGAFEGIYSTKPETLLIPGRIPDFSKFFMEQNLKTLSENIVLVDKPIGPLQFAQPNALTGEYEEIAYYWGKLENLYINFDLFKKELEAPNKTIRDVLETLLNEMSTAVDSFWNFQIVEKTAKIEKKDTTVYTVIDENWIGKNKSTPKLFVHSGEQSRFLEANLDINIPSAMTGKIIAKRLSLSVNPSQPNIETGRDFIFTNKLDKFMTGYVKGNAVAKNLNVTTTTTQVDSALKTRLNAAGTAILTPAQEEEKNKLVTEDSVNAAAKTTLKTNYDADTASYNAVIAGQKIEIEKNDQFGLNTDAQNAAIAKAEAIIIASENKIKELKTQYDKDLAPLITEETRIEEAAKKYESGIAEQIVATVSSNLEKIDVVPNPEVNMITQDNLTNFMTDLSIFDQKFRIYCCRDNKFFNLLKVNKMGKKSGGGGRLSHPLPIKYSFTILGKSGIRRGDTFNIIGIPKKYAKHGLFQVTQIEHTVQNMKWTTRVQGEYRQQQ